MIKVVNKRTHIAQHNDLYIGRPSKWGNPFVIGKDGTREEVISRYTTYLLKDDELLADLHELKGKNLVCWCSPAPCHGDILKMACEEIYGK